MLRMFTLIAIVAAAALHGAAITHAAEWDIGADSRQRSEALQSGRVVEGVVVQLRNIRVAPTTAANTVSAGVGGLLGAALGSQAGKGNGKYIAGVLGAVLGGVAGNAVGERVSSAVAQELIVRKRDGVLVSITQAESSLYAGQAVYLVESYGKIRVIPQHAGSLAAM